MDKLEMLGQFKKLYGSNINPDITSFLYCQSEAEAYTEMFFQTNSASYIINLDFIAEWDESKTQEEQPNNLLMFNPSNDIVDNAKLLIEMDEYSLINCIDHLFTQAAIEDILKRTSPSTTIWF